MFSKTLAFFLGIVIFLQLPIELPFYCVLVLLALSVLLRKKKFFKLCFYFFLGMLWVSVSIYDLESSRIPERLQAKAMLIQAKIISLVKHQGHLQSFYVEAVGAVTGKIKLSAYGQGLPLQAGETWQWMVKLKKPWGFANPGGFLYQDYLSTQGVIATGYVLMSAQNRLLKPAAFGILRLRSMLSQDIQQYAHDYTRFMQALSIGDRNQFSEQDWEVLQKTGTNHLVAISGLHIGLVAALLFYGLQCLWRRSRVLCLLLPAQIAGAYAAIMIACVYSALAGFAVPTQRAAVMLTMFMLALIARRALMTWHTFSMALLLVLILNPLSVLDSGFYLSFFAVAALILASETRKNRLLRWIRPQCIVILGVSPWTIYYFHQFSWVSPLANIITIPVVGFVIVPLCLMSCLFFCIHANWVAALLLGLSEKVMAVVWWVLTTLSQTSVASMTVGYFPVWKLAIALILVFAVLSRLAWVYKLPILCLLPLMWIKPMPMPVGDFKFSLLDVGQGLASVIQTRHHVLVFDTGPKFSADFNAGTAVVLPFLQSQGVHTVDMLVVSHGDSDHIGGAPAILHVLRVLAIRSSVPERFHQATYCLAGQHWQWDGVNFEFLYPDRQHLGLDNNSSCVLKVSNAVGSVLSTGDIQEAAERYVVMHQDSQLQATVLIAPHHGSKTSSSLLFLKTVKPAWVLFPVGYLNHFHFPNQVVVERYQHLHIQMLSTASCGAIMLSFNRGQPLVPICYRQTLPFYLH